jgi:hypothetical protein
MRGVVYTYVAARRRRICQLSRTAAWILYRRAAACMQQVVSVVGRSRMRLLVWTYFEALARDTTNNAGKMINYSRSTRYKTAVLLFA